MAEVKKKGFKTLVTNYDELDEQLLEHRQELLKKGLKIAAIIFGVIVLIDITPSQALRRVIVLWALSPM